MPWTAPTKTPEPFLVGDVITDPTHQEYRVLAVHQDGSMDLELGTSPWMWVRNIYRFNKIPNHPGFRLKSRTIPLPQAPKVGEPVVGKADPKPGRWVKVRPSIGTRGGQYGRVMETYNGGVRLAFPDDPTLRSYCYEELELVPPGTEFVNDWKHGYGWSPLPLPPHDLPSINNTPAQQMEKWAASASKAIARMMGVPEAVPEYKGMQSVTASSKPAKDVREDVERTTHVPPPAFNLTLHLAFHGVKSLDEMIVKRRAHNSWLDHDADICRECNHEVARRVRMGWVTMKHANNCWTAKALGAPRLER